jgi:hypothetical protein
LIDTLRAVVAERPHRVLLHDYVPAPWWDNAQRHIGSHEPARRLLPSRCAARDAGENRLFALM